MPSQINPDMRFLHNGRYLYAGSLRGKDTPHCVTDRRFGLHGVATPLRSNGFLRSQQPCVAYFIAATSSGPVLLILTQ